MYSWSKVNTWVLTLSFSTNPGTSTETERLSSLTQRERLLFLFLRKKERQVFSIQDQYRPVFSFSGRDRSIWKERKGRASSLFLFTDLASGKRNGEKTTSDGSYPPSSLEDLLSIRLSCSSSSLSGGGEEVLTDGDNLKADVILEDVTGDDRYWSEQLYCYECHEQGC